MRNISTKVNGVDSLDGGDFNATQDEIETVATTAGITIDPAGGPNTDLTMLSQATANYVAGGMIYDDSGSINSVVLSRSETLADISGYKDNQIFVFKPAANNTGATTVNVAGKGVKNLTNNGVSLVAGVLNTSFYTVFRYELTGDRCEIVNMNTKGITAHNIIIDTTGGDFTSIASYLAGTPASGDRVLVKNDQTITSPLIIPAGVSIFGANSWKIIQSGVFSPVVTLNEGSGLYGDLTLLVDLSSGLDIATAITISPAASAYLENLVVEPLPSPTNRLLNIIDVTTNVNVRGVVTSKMTGFADNYWLTTGTSAVDLIMIDASLDSIIPFSASSQYTASLIPSSSGSIALSAATLAVTRQGNVVTIQGKLQVLSVSAPIGNLRLSLPHNRNLLFFTPQKELAGGVAFENLTLNISNIHIDGSGVDDTTLGFKSYADTSVTGTPISASTVTATTNIYINISYLANPAHV